MNLNKNDWKELLTLDVTDRDVVKLNEFINHSYQYKETSNKQELIENLVSVGGVVGYSDIQDYVDSMYNDWNDINELLNGLVYNYGGTVDVKEFLLHEGAIELDNEQIAFFYL